MLLKRFICWIRGHDYEKMCDFCTHLSQKDRIPTECTITGVRCNENKHDDLKRCKRCGKLKRG